MIYLKNHLTSLSSALVSPFAARTTAFVTAGLTTLTTAFVTALINTSTASASETETSPKQIDFSSLEQGELYPAGKASTKRTRSKRVLAQISPQLDLHRKLDSKVGEAIFEKIWVLAPSSTQASDGLGPLYNARSCNRCHINNSRGVIESVTDNDKRNIALFVRLSIPARSATEQQLLDEHALPFIAEPNYGAQLQNFAYPDGEAEGQLSVSYSTRTVKFADGSSTGLQAPSYHISHLGYGPLADNTMISPRMAPPMHGLGLLNAIAERDIKAWADPDDLDADGISGKARITRDLETGQLALGRFGYKAGAASLDQQNLGALAGDIGIGNRLYPSPYGDCTPAQAACFQQAHGNTANQDGLEASRTMTQALLDYTQSLGVPKRIASTAKAVLAGKKHFHQLGCASCHRPSFTTASNAKPNYLADQTIWPYSDMLLHDMGPGLADNRPEGNANGQEWRTAPLWGLSLSQRAATQDFYLHDGRARSITEAILWHGGEAAPSQLAFRQLDALARTELIKFLESL